VIRKTLSQNSTRSVQLSPDACLEMVRDAIPILAEPIRPGEKVSGWMDRAARRCGIGAERLTAFWHRRVSRPYADEYIAILDAANAELRRRAAIESLETEIEVRAALLRADHERLVDGHPVLARLVPRPPAATQAEEAAPGAVVRRRAGGGR